MGFFSWKTSDTNTSISNAHSTKPTFPVYMILPDGRYYLETDYEGYGEFGGRDYYGVVAELNLDVKPEKATLDLDPDIKFRDDEWDKIQLAHMQQVLDSRFDEEYRGQGISLACGKAEPGNLYYAAWQAKNPKRKLKLPRFAETLVPWNTLKDSSECKRQGFFY